MKEPVDGRMGESANVPLERNSPHRRFAPSPALYVVATPIGNLTDITLRALETLKKVDLILCEDKRITSRLLNKYAIKTKIKSHHKYNEHKSAGEAISLLVSGKDIALVSDAGTPLISDPGKTLIAAAMDQNIKVIPVPGPSALLAALSVCPFESENSEFLFIGFLPENKSKRKDTLCSLKNRSKNIVIYIAPHDIKKYIAEINNIYPDSEIFIAREISKIYEELWKGKIPDLIWLLENKTFKGEIVVILHINKQAESLNMEHVLSHMKNHITEGHSLKETSKTFAKEYNLSAKRLYDLYLDKYI